MNSAQPTISGTISEGDTLMPYYRKEFGLFRRALLLRSASDNLLRSGQFTPLGQTALRQRNFADNPLKMPQKS